MIASAAIFNENDSIYLPPPPARGLSYYLDLGKYYRRQRETLNRGEWNDHKKEQGNFLDKCLNIIDSWDKLAEDLQNALLNLDYPSYLSATAVSALFKVPAQIMGECLERLKTLIEGGKPLTSKDIEKTARLFHTKRKNYLVIEEVVTEGDWELVARKYRALKDPARLDLFQEEARRLAGDGTIFTEHVIEALSNFGHDPAKILPKPKKKYSDRDLVAATAPLERERDSLKSENTALKRLLEQLGFPLPENESENNGNEMEKDTEIKVEMTEKSEFFSVKAIAENENPETGSIGSDTTFGPETVPQLLQRDDLLAGSENDTTFRLETVIIPETLSTVPLVSLDNEGDSSRRTVSEPTEEPSVESLKGRRARTRLGRDLIPGQLIDHNGSLKTWLFRSGEEGNARTFFLKAETIEVESPPGSGNYRALSSIVERIGEKDFTRKSNPIPFSPARKREKTKGFGKTS